MSYVDQAIVKYADLVAPIGVDLVRQDARLILDGAAPCNEKRGWYGTKPGCKRGKANGGQPAPGESAPTPTSATKAKKGAAKSSAKTKKTGAETGGKGKGGSPKPEAVKAPKRDTETINVDKLSQAEQSAVAEKIADSLRLSGKLAQGADFDSAAYDSMAIHMSMARKAVISPEKIRVIKDSSGDIQASATVEKRDGHLFVEYLATAPWNMPDAPADDRKKKGMGSRLLTDIVKESFAAGNNGVVKLEAKKSAIGFYEKMGFKVKDGYYELSEDAAKSLLDRMGERMDAEEQTFADELSELEDAAGGALATNYRETKTSGSKKRMAKIIEAFSKGKQE